MNTEVQDALKALEVAENHFDNATREYALAATYELSVAIEKCNAAIARAKAQRDGVAV